MKRFLFSSLLLGGLAQATPIPVSQCWQVISAPGRYALTKNLVCVNLPKAVITIQNTRDVELDLKGYTITFIPLIGQPFVKKATGVLVTGSEDVDIDGEPLSRISRARFGLRVVNSDDVDVKRLRLEYNTFGASYSGAQTEDADLEDSQFGGNSCDLQVTAGAQQPDLDDISPSNPSRCF